MRAILLRAVSGLCLVVAASAHAADLDAEQRAVWRVEEQVWKKVQAKDLSWIEDDVHPRATYWTFDAAAPADRATLARLERESAPGSTLVDYALTPESITVTGDVAVVHYRYAATHERANHARERSTGRYTDVFVRDHGRWRYIAWAGGDDPKP